MKPMPYAAEVMKVKRHAVSNGVQALSISRDVVVEMIARYGALV